MVVCYFFDRKYARHTLTSIYSLLVNKNKVLRIYCVYLEGVRTVDLSKINKLCSAFKAHVVFIKQEKSPLMNFDVHSHFSHANFGRLLLPEILKNESKVLYLDSDTIINGNITDLYLTEIDEYLFAGVVDEVGAKSTKIPGVDYKKYINSGVLLMNLEFLRIDNYYDKILQVYSKYRECITWVDQCLINIYARDRIKLIDNGYNRRIYSSLITESAWDNCKSSLILHFVGSVKPWDKGAKFYVRDYWNCYSNYKIKRT